MSPLTAYTLGCFTPPSLLAVYALFGSLHYRAAWEQFTLGGFRPAWIVMARNIGVSLAHAWVEPEPWGAFTEKWWRLIRAMRADAHAAHRYPWCPWMLYPPVWWWTLRALFGVRL